MRESSGYRQSAHKPATKGGPGRKAKKISLRAAAAEGGGENPIRSAVLLHDVDTGQYQIEFTFRALHGESAVVRVPRQLQRQPSEMVKRLLDAGCCMPNDRTRLTEFVEHMANAASRILPVTGKAGWRRGAFVFPDRTIAVEQDPNRSLRYVANDNQGFAYGQRAGSFSRWRSKLEVPCERSRFLTFGIALAFAGPLLELLKAELSEAAFFLLAGPSGSGKTLTCQAAQSVTGAATGQDLVTFDATKRGFEEIFSAYNDATLVLDEVGRAADTKKEREDQLSWLAYIAACGRGKIRATRSQKDALANKTWRILGLGSTEEQIDGDDRLTERRGGEQVRLIQLVVPPLQDGGIFDRAVPGPSTLREQSERLAKIVRETVHQDYGLAIRRFVSEIIADPGSRSHARVAFEKFLGDAREQVPGCNLRLASKFAIIYAAGRLASRYKLAPWTRAGLRDAVFTLWRRSADPTGHLAGEALEAVRQLQALAEDRGAIVKLKRGSPLPATAIGLRQSPSNAPRQIVFVPERLAKRMGEVQMLAALRYLDREGILIKGGNGASKRQVRIAGLPGGKRHRCYAADAQKLRDLIIPMTT